MVRIKLILAIFAYIGAQFYNHCRCRIIVQVYVAIYICVLLLRQQDSRQWLHLAQKSQLIFAFAAMLSLRRDRSHIRGHFPRTWRRSWAALPCFASTVHSISYQGFDHVYVMIGSLDEWGHRTRRLKWIETTTRWNSNRLHLHANESNGTQHQNRLSPDPHSPCTTPR